MMQLLSNNSMKNNEEMIKRLQARITALESVKLKQTIEIDELKRCLKYNNINSSKPNWYIF
ncbi:hypothetical protein [Legionella moravica]|uniref:hypothetical protein n=1 Tax=Legionella moravica TaxID=39962 RepID=UPI00072F0979|nr:hypothetical protein [Legionella moravica]